MYRVPEPTLPSQIAELDAAKQRVSAAYAAWIAATPRGRRELERQRRRIATVLDAVHARYGLADAMTFAWDWEQHAWRKLHRPARKHRPNPSGSGKKKTRV
jgi:hypothetical protein